MKKAVVCMLCVFAFSAIFLTDGYTLRLGNKDLIKLGVGQRTMFLIGTVYYASLWVPQELKGKSAKEIIEADEPCAVILNIDSKLITTEKFLKATREGFAKAAASGYPTAKSEAFLSKFKDIQMSKGDVVYLYYTPGVGLDAKYKSKATGETKNVGVTPGLDFKKALFAIWLGPNPVQESLKKGMLGQ
ncbi:MAG: chalcone isomerase family protein [Spirochaetes bacterium]|nr:chalcone isomerase family protein [Spirochaetota bacterium]